MAQKNFKINEAIKVFYQAPNSATGKTVNMEVYDETDTIVAGGPTVLGEIAATGRYQGSFTPDAAGEWSIQVQISDGTGKVVKSYSVGSYNVNDVGGGVDTVDGKVDDVDSALTTVDTKVDSVDSVLTTVDTAIGALEDISKSDVNAEIESVLDTYDAPTKAELDAAQSALETAIDDIVPGSGAMLG